MISAAAVAVLALVSTSGVLAGNHFGGIVAGNSVGNDGTYTCRSQDQWNQVASDAAGAGFPVIRIEGFDCNSLDMVSQAAQAHGLKVFAGIYVDGTIANGMTGINNDVQTFRTAYAKYGAGLYTGLAVGNEVQDSPDNIMQKVYDVRGYLGSVGVSTPVGTAHTWVEVFQNPQLCGADFIGANAHGWYDPNTTSDSVGNWMQQTVMTNLRNSCPNANLYISETGWPSQGGSNGPGTASVNDETNALRNLNCAAPNVNAPIFAFEYDDQTWKSGAVEQSFGIFGKIDLNGQVFNVC